MVGNKSPKLFFKCPYANCNLVIPESFVLKYLDHNNAQRYTTVLGKIYCEESKTMKWCPSPGCEFACENT